MKEKHNICEDLSGFLNSNVTIIEYETLKSFRNIIFKVPFEYELDNSDLKKIKNKLKENNLLCILENVMKVGYLVILEEKEKYFVIIGPFLIENLELQVIQEIKKNDKELYEFYNNLKNIKITSYKILTNIIKGLINKRYLREENEIFIELKLEKKEKLRNYSLNDEIMNYRSISQRYLYENLMLNNIKNGNIEKSLFYNKKLLTEFDMASRLPLNQLRAKKNGAYIGVGMIRKVIEELKIPSVKIHLISSKYFYKLEEANTITEIDKIRSEMIVEYSQACLEQRKSTLKGIVKKALYYIEINLEKNIKVRDIASYSEVSSEHLSRTFKNEVGISLKKYINIEKIKLSIKFLKNKNYRIRDIATKLEFSSMELYIKNFKNIMGVTPAEYRRNLVEIE